MRFVRNKLSDERGIAIPVALAVLVMAAGLATVAARTGIVASHQSFRDRNVKSASQATASALQVAIYRTNLLQPSNTQCVVKDPSTGTLSNAAVQADGWCAAQTETLGDGASYTFRVSQVSTVNVTGQILAERKIVATGTANGVRRRATVTVNAATGDPLFPTGYALVARESVEFKNNADITGGVGSNGDITFKNNADTCGPITYGPGKKLNTGPNFAQCAGAPAPAPAAQPFPFQPVDMTGPRASNDNQRLTNMKNGSGSPTDTCTGCNKVLWSAGTRVLTIQNGGVLTLTGNTYVVCQLNLNSNGQLKISARSTPLFVYIDTPENCGGTSGMGSASLSGQVLNVNSSASTFVLLVAGSASPTKATTVSIADNAVTAANAPMAIYAPNSTVDYDNNLDWKGAIVAKRITMKNNATVTYDPSIAGITLGNPVRFYEAHGYKECAIDPTSSTPDSGC